MSLKTLISAQTSGSLTDVQTYDLLNKLILTYDYTSEAALAEPYLDKALELVRTEFGSNDSRMCFIYNELGYLYIARKDNAKSEECFLKALAIAKEDKAENWSYYSAILCSLALLYNNQDRYQEALPLTEQAYKLQSEALGEEHPELVFTLNLQARILHHLGRYPAAENAYLKARHIIEQKLGLEHISYYQVMSDLSALYILMQRFEEAGEITLGLLALQTKLHGNESREVARLHWQLSKVLSNQAKPDDAEREVRKALDIFSKVAEPDNADYLAARQSLVKFSLGRGDFAEAESELREIIGIYHKQNLEGTMLMALTEGNLSKVYEKQGKLSEAEQRLRHTVDFFAEKAPEHPNYLYFLENYMSILAKSGKQKEVDKYKSKVEELKTRLEQSREADKPA